MRFTFLAAILAALLLAFGPSATPTFAADRPVGPETGQARTSADQVSHPGGPDDGADFIPFPSAPGEIWATGPTGCPAGPLGRICRWMQEYERNTGPIGF